MAFSFLEPLFTAVGMPLATAALYVLAFGAASIGMCLGILLPLILPGACFGVSVAILIGFFVPAAFTQYMGIFIGVTGFVGMLLSFK